MRDLVISCTYAGKEEPLPGCPIGNLKSPIQDGKSLSQLLFGDDERGDDQNRVPVSIHEHPVVEHVFPQGRHFWAGSVKGAIGSRVSRLRTSSSAPNKPIERTSPTDGCRSTSSASISAMTRPIASDRSTSRSDCMTWILAIAAARRNRVAIISQAALVDPVVKRLGNFLAHGDGAKGSVARGQAFCHGHQVWRHIPMIDREPFPGPAETAHHLIRDQEDSIPVAQPANPLEITMPGER